MYLQAVQLTDPLQGCLYCLCREGLGASGQLQGLPEVVWFVLDELKSCYEGWNASSLLRTFLYLKNFPLGWKVYKVEGFIPEKVTTQHWSDCMLSY